MIEYELHARLSETVDAVMLNKEFAEFKPLRDAKLTIIAVLKTKVDSKGEHQEMSGKKVELKKVPALFTPFTDAQYLLVVNYHAFMHWPDSRLDAEIHKALMSILVEPNEGGGYSVVKRDPDVITYSATVARYGAYDDGLLDMKAAMKSALKAGGSMAADRIVESNQPERQAA